MGSCRLIAYEHDRLRVGETYPSARGGREVFTEDHFEALARYQERTGTPALRIGHRSIRLAQHVGYLRVGPIALQIYPKLGSGRPDENWRALLLHMLRVVVGIRLAPQEHAPLQARAGDLFEILVRRFLELTHALLREGLARTYREVEENSTMLRGRLLMSPHVRENHLHRERVFVAYDVRDSDNLPNRMLKRALERVLRMTGSSTLLRDAEAALVDFPDVSDAPIARADWDRIRLDRRTVRYREALGLARLILTEERPDLRWGDREIVALLFDMNALFESYLDAALRGVEGLRVKAQVRRRFWLSTDGERRMVKPDLLVYERDDARPIVVDAKWKIPAAGRPDDDDLRQVFAYLQAFDAERGLLVYPRASAEQAGREGTFVSGKCVGGVVFVELLPGGRPNLAAMREALPALLTLR